ncbi:MAG TPA: terminase family protein, partial [Dehalococcoidia bacterium]|nr:terminase family protein [Dehalococcoidia bacterium]
MDNPWIAKTPTAKQATFLACPNEEAFSGGSGGGGKSFALLMAALQYVPVPGYAALLLRRTFRQLAQPDAIMDLSHKWLGGTAARWDVYNKTWRFPSGATLSFGYLENEADKYQYQGTSLQFIGFDELTQFHESEYRFLFGWLRRREGLEAPLRMRAASNPGGIGHDWVKQRFLVEGRAMGRPFIPARLWDNPHIDREAYRRSLENLDPVTREQILNGNWEARQAGAMFRREWFEVVDAAPALAARVRFWDMAG